MVFAGTGSWQGKVGVVLLEGSGAGMAHRVATGQDLVSGQEISTSHRVAEPLFFFGAIALNEVSAGVRAETAALRSTPRSSPAIFAPRPGETVPIGFPGGIEEYRAAQRLAIAAEQRGEKLAFPVGGLFGKTAQARQEMSQVLPRLSMKNNAFVGIGVVDHKAVSRWATSMEKAPLPNMVPFPEPPPGMTMPDVLKFGRGRFSDTEYKWAFQALGETHEGSAGWMWGYTEKDPCPSCFLALEEFQAKRKGIEVIVTSGGYGRPTLWGGEAGAAPPIEKTFPGMLSGDSDFGRWILENFFGKNPVK
jgi:hypothetical protein